VSHDHGYVPFVVITIRFCPYSCFVTGFVTTVTRQVPHVEQELLTLPEHLSSLPLFTCLSWVRVVHVVKTNHSTQRKPWTSFFVTDILYQVKLNQTDKLSDDRHRLHN
jgi:hypothetical protein